MVPVDNDRARFCVRDAAAAALFLGPVLEDLDRSGLLSAGHADDGDGALLRRGVDRNGIIIIIIIIKIIMMIIIIIVIIM